MDTLVLILDLVGTFVFALSGGALAVQQGAHGGLKAKNHQNQTSATIMTTPNNTSRYISRLRRAFLLRVHPDRVRAQSEHVRREQAVLVQMLSDRLGEQDFLEFATPSLR